MEHETEAQELLRVLQEYVSTYVFKWSGPHYDNSGCPFWFDTGDCSWEYSAHPGGKMTFDECVITLRHRYMKEEPLQNYTLEEFILSRIEDGSDK